LLLHELQQRAGVEVDQRLRSRSRSATRLSARLSISGTRSGIRSGIPCSAGAVASPLATSRCKEPGCSISGTIRRIGRPRSVTTTVSPARTRATALDGFWLSSRRPIVSTPPMYLLHVGTSTWVPERPVGLGDGGQGGGDLVGEGWGGGVVAGLGFAVGV